MKKVTLIRHAQSKFNAGHYKSEDELRNCGLTEFGMASAKSLNQTFDVVVISTLRRAIQTYNNSNIKTDNVLYSELIREQREDGVLNYLEGEEIVPETPNMVRERAKNAIKFIKSLNYENIGIITHAHFIWYFLEQCGQKPVIIKNTESITFLL